MLLVIGIEIYKSLIERKQTRNRQQSCFSLLVLFPLNTAHDVAQTRPFFKKGHPLKAERLSCATSR